MRTKPWIIFITLFSAILFCMMPPRSSHACAGGDDEEEWYTSFLNTDLLDSGIQYNGQYFWNDDWLYLDDQDKLGKDINLKDWAGYLKLNNAEKDIEWLVYTSKAGQLDSIKNLINTRQALPEKYAQNIAVKQLWNQKKTDVLDYLHALRLAEPITLRDNYSWQENNPNIGQASGLCEQAKAGIQHAKSGFLKQRYAYHAIRMAMLGGNAAEAVKLYKKHIKTGKKMNQLDYWSMSYAAGAYLNLGDSARASYMFSRLYEMCPSRVQTARSSFKISTDENWHKCLDLCKNDHEKAEIWLLAGNTRLMPELECINQAYKLKTPANKLGTLLAQDMYHHDVVSNRVPLDPNNPYYNDEPKGEQPIPETSIALTDSSRIALYTKIAEDKNTVKKTPWLLAIAYLHYENNDLKKAEELLNNIQADSKELEEQKDILLSVIILDRSVTKNDESLEKELLPHLSWLEPDNRRAWTKAYNDAKKYISTNLALRYNKNGHRTKALAASMLIHNTNYLQTNANMQDLDSLIAFEDKNGKTTFEEFLFNKLPSRSDLFELKGTLYLADFDFNHALQCFKQVTEHLDDLPADPFMIHNHDCHDCDYNDKNKVAYTKLGLTEAFIKLETEKDKDPAQAAEKYFKLANAYYNVTVYGNSWSATRYYYSSLGYQQEYGSNEVDGTFNHEKPFARTGDGMQRALSYYMKAKGLSNSREFQAKCVFMAAKCELNIAYDNNFSNQKPTASVQDLKEVLEKKKKLAKQVKEEDGDLQDIDKEDVENNMGEGQKTSFDLYLVDYFGKFNLLMNQYSDTQYYKEVIEECSYLSGYAEGLAVNRNDGANY